MRAIVPAALAAVLTLFSAGAQELGASQAVMPVPGAPQPMSLYPSQAQGQYLGGVTQGAATDTEMALSLDDAIQRGLKNNLGTLVNDQERRRSAAERLKTLADLLPNLSVRTQGSEQQVNLAAFGFSNFPGIAPIIGPFGLFDARAYLTQRVLDFHSIRNTQASGQMVKASAQNYQNSRDTVALVVGGLYLQTLAGDSRVESERTQVKTAEAVYNQAVDYKKSGVIPAIDVLRAQVELEAERQRLVSAENDFEKMKLSLAQAIGLPLAQQFRLTDRLSPESAPAVTLQQALDQAYDNRSDYRSAQSLVKAAEFARRAAVAERYPTVAASFDYGAIGQSVTQNHGTFTAAIGVNIPIYEGGRTDAKVTEADAALKQREAERDALRSRIEFEVRSVFLDLKSTLDQVTLASNAKTLADAQVAQARDRFAAGVATSLEVVQAQQALAVASDNYISSLFNYNLAKGSLARTAGQAEKLFRLFVLGDK
ncbi:MAG: TolC family protein [Bryobacteraceae bacterium]|nr:TolC family protein [Bryobacteraceae bacterium]